MAHVTSTLTLACPGSRPGLNLNVITALRACLIELVECLYQASG